MRKRNWSEYNKHLVRQGSISFFIESKVFRSIQYGPASKKIQRIGRPQQFSDPLIQILLMLKIRFRLPYRALEGFAKSLFKKREVAIPTYSLICKRVEGLSIALDALKSNRAITVLLDASGAKICGEGEWKVKIHGRSVPRKWVKLHLAVDSETGEIVAECTTKATVADSAVTKKLLDKVPGKINVVMADGAYDRSSSREVIKKRKAKALIPPPKNARYRGTNSERDQAIAVIRGLGGDKEARSIWAKLSGYNKRVLVESVFSRKKRLFGNRLFSKVFDKQCIENTARCVLLNEMRMRATLPYLR